MSAKRYALNGLGLLAMAAATAALADAPAKVIEPATATTQPAESLPSAEEVLNRFIEVTGGREAWAKLRTRRMEGTLEFVGMGITAQVATLEAPPRQSLVVLDITGAGKVEEGCDGNVAWTRSLMNGPHIAEGAEQAFRLRMSVFNEHLHWDTLYTHVECVGLETLDGKSCYKLVLTPPQGEADTMYYDRESGLRLRWDFSVPSPMGIIPVQHYPEDYRTVDGVRIPHRMVQHVLGQRRVLTIAQITHNEKLPRDSFALPDDIAALRKKQQRQTVTTEVDVEHRSTRQP